MSTSLSASTRESSKEEMEDLRHKMAIWNWLVNSKQECDSEERKEIFTGLKPCIETIPGYKRPKFTEFEGTINGKSAVRVATWNLDRFSLDKANNKGVLEVVCCTLLENRISLLAVQELVFNNDTELNKLTLQKVCDELNEPTLPAVRYYTRTHGLTIKENGWQCEVSGDLGPGYQIREAGGFIFNTEQGVKWKGGEHKQRTTYDAEGNRSGEFTRRPLEGNFVLNNELNVQLVSLHLNCGEQTKREDEIRGLPKIPNVFSQDHVIFLGDFNGFSSTSQEQHTDLHLLDHQFNTNISLKKPDGTQKYDNILVETKMKNLVVESQVVGNQVVKHPAAHVVREGLRHPYIPDNVDRFISDGYVSNHCPVYATFFTRKPEP